MGDFVNSSYFFRISGLEGFLYSVPPQGNLSLIGQGQAQEVDATTRAFEKSGSVEGLV